MADPKPPLPLLHPACRQGQLQLFQHYTLICLPREDRLDDVGRQPRQAGDPAQRGHQRVASKAPALRAAAKWQRSTISPTGWHFRETGTLHPYEAEALAGGRLHHQPALQAVHHLGAEFLQARHFGRDVVGLDVYVDATSWSTRWICTMGSSGGVSSMR